MTNTETIIAIIVNTKTTKMTTTMVAFWHQLIIIFSHNGTTFGDKFFLTFAWNTTTKRRTQMTYLIVAKANDPCTKERYIQRK